jgi:RimJ/RimL family protein N-acetyltransferase
MPTILIAKDRFTLAAEPISLREIREADLDLLRQHRNDPGTRAWLEDDREVSAAQQLHWFRNGGSASLRIALSTGVEVGLARLAHDTATRTCSVGLDIFKPFRGRGLARPVFRHICVTAVASGARCLILWVFEENVRAMRVYLAEGFVLDRKEPPKRLSRQFPHEDAPGMHGYVKMFRDMDGQPGIE